MAWLAPAAEHSYNWQYTGIYLTRNDENNQNNVKPGDSNITTYIWQTKNTPTW